MNPPSFSASCGATVLAAALFLVAWGEYGLRRARFDSRSLLPLWRSFETGYVQAYAQWRSMFIAHPGWVILGVLGFSVFLVAYRSLYVFWHNVVVAHCTGTQLGEKNYRFTKHEFALLDHVAQTPRGTYFLGLSPERRPVVVDEATLNTHLHAVGPTGTGKTESLLFVLLLQDARAGKGAVFIDAKGAYSAIERFKAIAALAGRSQDVRIFSLEHPQSCHTYNPLHLGPNPDPLATAERIFSDFHMDNEYYRGQAKQLFYNLVRLVAGAKLSCNFRDLRLLVTHEAALEELMARPGDQEAKFAISQQLAQLGRRRYETFTGLVNALADYDPGGAISEALGSYNPDIVLEDVVNQRLLVYFHLPANRYQQLAPALGKIVLRHLSAVGAARDARPKAFDPTPFSVTVDECHQFVFEGLLMALTMLRSAKFQFRLAHQTLAQLEAVSPSFERTVRTNTRCKVLFYSDDPDHLELVARSYGTRTSHKRTVRYRLGPLWTLINTGDASHKEVQEFRVHPDALKSLAMCGQGYLLLPNKAQPLSFAMIPDLGILDYPLRRKPAASGLDVWSSFVLPHLMALAPTRVDGKSRAR